jgi:hypothetical protein
MQLAARPEVHAVARGLAQNKSAAKLTLLLACKFFVSVFTTTKTAHRHAVEIYNLVCLRLKQADGISQR